MQTKEKFELRAESKDGGRARGQLERSLDHCIRYRRRCSRLWQEESGQTLVLAAACMIVLIGMLGLSVDAGILRYSKRQVQNLADAAALAAALELSACGGTSNCSAMQTAVQSAIAENGTNGSLLTNCAARTGTKLEVTLNNPPCALSSDPNRSNANFAEVIVSEPVPTVFAQVFKVSSVPVMARAEAAKAPLTCVYSLDPSGSSAMVFDSGTTVSGTCGAIEESTSSAAIACTSSYLTIPFLYLLGGGTDSNCSGSTTLTFASRPNPPNPLSSLTKPAIPSCGASSSGPVYHGSPTALTLSGSATLYPDAAYCGGIVVQKSATVTFEPGVYVLGSGATAGGLSVDVGATVNGTGVTFYNDGSSGAVSFSYTSSGSGGVSLIATTTGTYAGILFYQDPGNTSTATLLGQSAWNTILQGTYYFPTAKVIDSYSGSSAYNILVAYDVEFAKTSGTGASSFSSNYSSLPNGSPLPGAGVYLIE